jgi:predicted AAA+ superfamily ATPase
MLSKTLLAGVPLVVVPGGGDQWELANRVVRQGSGKLVRPLTAEALIAAIAEVLWDPRYREFARRAGESLAGRIAYRELTPFHALELADSEFNRLWLRGGFPDSHLASTPSVSLRWRQDFMRTCAERDIPLLGGRVGAESVRRLWGMLAHQQGGLFNASVLARSLALDIRTVNRYIDLLVQMFLLRRLQPWHANLGKRLTKSPKLYVRDSGLLHALLGLSDEETLLGHPAVGASWEGFVLENLITAAGPHASDHF